MDRVYAELRALAAYHMQRERREHTLPPTAVVHEAYLRLAAQDKAVWGSRAQFIAVASTMIRRILVDHARRHCAAVRARAEARINGPRTDPDNGVDVRALDEALGALERLDPRQARVVELRYFGGLTLEQTAEVVGVSVGTVKGDWRLARAWLRARLEP